MNVNWCQMEPKGCPKLPKGSPKCVEKTMLEPFLVELRILMAFAGLQNLDKGKLSTQSCILEVILESFWSQVHQKSKNQCLWKTVFLLVFYSVFWGWGFTKWWKFNPKNFRKNDVDKYAQNIVESGRLGETVQTGRGQRRPPGIPGQHSAGSGETLGRGLPLN